MPPTPQPSTMGKRPRITSTLPPELKKARSDPCTLANSAAAAPKAVSPNFPLASDKRNLSEARGGQSEPARPHRQRRHHPSVPGRRTGGAGVIGSCRSAGTRQRGFDRTLDEDRQKATNPSVGELSSSALDLRTHLGLVMLPVTDVPSHQLVFELGQLSIERIVGIGVVRAGSAGGGHDGPPGRNPVPAPVLGVTAVGDERASNRVNVR